MSASDDFRAAMSRYPTGVTVVSTYHEGRAVGMTANSFASVSLEPPLVLWSVGKTGSRGQVFSDAKSFSICFLGSDQSEIAKFCADNEALPAGRWSENAYGFPVVENCPVVLDCRQHAVYPAGDHDIIIGEVLRISMRDEAGALTFYRSQYGTME
ncbi:flavin reductase family protein [Hyphobacterium sp. HN65]|uniref:Flavin reductase family protein n=1 Tax=Hyphobacterium lacteum TaxID=3116575 RepID=A0ABU7LM95_9PROT|nr:flavin reductase family protein [Hyphobacterium sp. HN65]MEE2525041.1 flavin reductase family protein [Hyphobacterium sp. HN65]